MNKNVKNHVRSQKLFFNIKKNDNRAQLINPLIFDQLPGNSENRCHLGFGTL
jgi:hypothetical protein